MGEMINWMGGWPREGIMPQAEWEERIKEAAGRSGKASNEEEREGADSVKRSLKLLAGRIAMDGWPGCGDAEPEDIAATAGANAAVEWVARQWLRPGDAVLVENPTGRSALQLFRKAGAVPHSVRSDGQGMIPADLAAALARLRPRLVYAAPACTDPEGRCWSGQRREALLACCREAGTAVLIDERQAVLRYEPPAEEAAEGSGAAARKPRQERAGGESGADGGTVFAVGELPPGAIAGARLGWLAVRAGAAAKKLVLPDAAGMPAALRPAAAEGRALLALMEERALEPLLETLRFVSQTRNGLLVELLERQRLPGLAWCEPEGGQHLWLKLPDGLDGDALLRAAWLKGLLFQPGSAFYAAEPDRCRIRVSAVHSEERQIRAGVQRLGEAMADFLGRSG